MQPLSTGNIQSIFLDQIRQIIPKNLSFPDELAEVLNVSRDSVYRRIRGETILSLEEVKKLCGHYKISLDALLSPANDIVSFRKRRVDSVNFTLEKWLASILNDLTALEAAENKEIVFSAKDIPIPYYFKFTNLAQFKLFFWLKSYQRHPKFDAIMKYDPEMVSQQLIELGKKIWDKFILIPSSEIFSEETFNVTVRQVQFYYENGFIGLTEVRALIDEYLSMIGEIRKSAAQGIKFGGGAFKLYYNEFLITNTTYLFKVGDRRIASIAYDALNILTTTQESFCRETEEFLNNVINKSTLISTVGERERNRFFNQVEKRIIERRDYLRH